LPRPCGDHLGGGVVEEIVEAAVVHESDDLAANDLLEIPEVDRHPRRRFDRPLDGDDEAVRVPVQLAALARMVREPVRRLEPEDAADDHSVFPLRARVICTPTASTMPSSTGVSFRTRTVTRSTLPSSRSSSRSCLAN